MMKERYFLVTKNFSPRKTGAVKPYIYIFCSLLTILIVTLKPLEAQYQFNFHHYNDVTSFNQLFLIPSIKTGNFSFDINASQDVSRNTTLAQNKEQKRLKLNVGMQPKHYLKFNVSETISQNGLETENIQSNITKNEILLKATYKPKTYLEFSPYYVMLSDRYHRSSGDSLDIDNGGSGEGIKGKLEIPNWGSASAALEFLNQNISARKKTELDADFQKKLFSIMIGGNLKGKNFLTQYPILNGREEKFHESTRGNIFGEFKFFNRVNTLIGYEGSYLNEKYNLLSGYSGKHNNEKRILHNVFSNIRYPLNSKITLNMKIERYEGSKKYQYGLNDELSTVKTLSPSISYHPNNNSEIRLERMVSLSSFNFPNPSTVTDRDILDKSVLLSTTYRFPQGTVVSLFMGRTENHIIYLRSEMSANNVRRVKYNIESNLDFILNNIVSMEEQFSLTSNYNLYDFSTDRNLFTRGISNKSKISFLYFSLFKPSLEYKFSKQDWGPYLFPYQQGKHLFYKNIENRKQIYRTSITIIAYRHLSFEPSYTLKRNRFVNYDPISGEKVNELDEEHLAISFTDELEEKKLIQILFTWIKRESGTDFYELKSTISYEI
jgi:hypothetical protein